MAEVSQAWLDRVNRAQQMAAERRGVDVSVMLPPRDGSAGASDDAAPTSEATAAPQPEPAAPATAEAPATQPSAQPAAAPVAEAAPPEAEAEAPMQEAAATQAAQEPSTVQSNGSGAAAAAERVAPVGRAAVLESFEAGQEGVNRREFLTYALGRRAGAADAGKRSGKPISLCIPASARVSSAANFRSAPRPLCRRSASPRRAIPPASSGSSTPTKAPRALYMVCTHLGCLYKWEPSNNRFECPCHGSKFNREGHYIEGPAPRSLDQFLVEIVQGGDVVSETVDLGDSIAAPALPTPDAEIVVDTGNRIVGKPKALSPAKRVVMAADQGNDTAI